MFTLLSVRLHSSVIGYTTSTLEHAYQSLLQAADPKKVRYRRHDGSAAALTKAAPYSRYCRHSTDTDMNTTYMVRVL
jgi:hypothetical protein